MDLLIIDTSAGISSNVTYFSLFAHDIIVLSSSEPTSITDAYALMKLLFIRYGERSFKLLVNAIQDSNEAMEVYRILKRVGERFLNLSIDYLGYVLMDDNLPRAVKRQRLMTELYPNSKASLCFKRIALKIGEYS
jgi:flagellar biosynthesis protein FlhG